MASNYLEELVSEWYEFQGYFIRRNVWVGKRTKGGFECELDVVAFHPTEAKLVQIEPSMDASSWKEREHRYQKKFKAGRKYIPALFKGFQLPREIDQIALFGFASKKHRSTLAGGRIVLVPELFSEILAKLKSGMYASMVSEQYPILRTLQFVAEYRGVVSDVLRKQ